MHLPCPNEIATPITMEEVFTTMMVGHKARTRATRTFPLGDLRISAINRLKNVVTAGTWSSRITVLRALNQFLQEHGLALFSLIHDPPTDATGIMLFLETIAHPATAYQYAKIIRGWYKTKGAVCPPVLDQYILARGREASKYRPKQAWAITKEELMGFAKDKQPMMQLALWLCWKTHSRWAEIAALTRRCFLQVDPSGIVVAFATHHTPHVTGIKTAHRNRFQMKHFLVVRDRSEEVMTWACNLINALPRYGTTKMFPWTTAQMDKLLATIPLRREIQEQMLEESMFPDPPPRHKHYTCHSIKKATMEITTSNIAAGLLPPKALRVIGKHASQMEEIPSTSVRYVHEHPQLAFLNGSQDITILV